MDMNVIIIKEEPLFKFEGCHPEHGQIIELYGDDLYDCKVGDSWSCMDQGCHPDRNEAWGVLVTVIFKDEKGVLLRFEHDNMQTSLHYIEFGCIKRV